MKKHCPPVKKNAPKPETIDATGIPLTEYYEDMRLFANGIRGGKSMPMGIDIFKKKGMKAWVDAWGSTQTVLAMITEYGRNTTANVPDAVIPDLTVLLTQMILGTGREKKYEQF